MLDLDFTIIDSKKWDALPTPTPPKAPDKYDKVLDALEAGEIIQIATGNAKEMKGLRITLGRKSAVRGFKVEYKTEDNILYVRKSDQEIQPKAPKERKKREKITQA